MKEENQIIIRCLNKYGKVPETYKLLEEIDLLEEENQRLNNVLNEARRILGEYKHYSTPDEMQNMINEEIVDKAYIKLYSNLNELKESDK